MDELKQYVLWLLAYIIGSAFCSGVLALLFWAIPFCTDWNVFWETIYFAVIALAVPTLILSKKSVIKIGG